MSKNGMSKFLDLFTLSDPDEYDDDLFDDDDEDEYVPPKKTKLSKSPVIQDDDDEDDDLEEVKKPKAKPVKQQKPAKQPASKPSSNNKLVSINSSRNSRNNSRGSEVYVIKPQDFNEAQSVTDFLKDGRAIVINMEGIELSAAQRIIDFIGGACYALDGSLQAISGNIFIAAPSNVDVTGDLRDEIINENTISPELGKY